MGDCISRISRQKVLQLTGNIMSLSWNRYASFLLGNIPHHRKVRFFPTARFFLRGSPVALLASHHWLTSSARPRWSRDFHSNFDLTVARPCLTGRGTFLLITWLNWGLTSARPRWSRDFLTLTVTWTVARPRLEGRGTFLLITWLDWVRLTSDLTETPHCIDPANRSLLYSRGNRLPGSTTFRSWCVERKES